MGCRIRNFAFILVVISSALFSGVLMGHEHAGQKQNFSSNVGKGKAVTNVHPELGFQLSPGALKTLDIQFQTLVAISLGSPIESFQVPAYALVQYQDKMGVFRLRDGWLKQVEVQVAGQFPRENEQASRVSVKSGELRAGDQVVVSGAPLLRVTELQLRGAGK